MTYDVSLCACGVRACGCYNQDLVRRFSDMKAEHLLAILSLRGDLNKTQAKQVCSGFPSGLCSCPPINLYLEVDQTEKFWGGEFPDWCDEKYRLDLTFSSELENSIVVQLSWTKIRKKKVQSFSAVALDVEAQRGVCWSSDVFIWLCCHLYDCLNSAPCGLLKCKGISAPS